MFPRNHRTLTWGFVVTALLGQAALSTSPRAGIGLFGVALALLLMERWWYLTPLRASYLSLALFGALGLAYVREPRGWFFLAGAVIVLGTGLRAEVLHRQFMAALTAQQRAMAAAREAAQSEHEEPLDEER